MSSNIANLKADKLASIIVNKQRTVCNKSLKNEIIKAITLHQYFVEIEVQNNKFKVETSKYHNYCSWLQNVSLALWFTLST